MCGWGLIHEPPEVTAEVSIDSAGVDALDSGAEELDWASNGGDVWADRCVLVEGVAEDSVVEAASEAEVDCSVECDVLGGWAGALSAEEPAEVVVEPPAPELRLRGFDAELCVPFEVLAAFVALSVLPGKALAATAVSTPVRAALPASSRRLARVRRRRAASRERGV
jgi:hypothetical protein